MKFLVGTSVLFILRMWFFKRRKRSLKTLVDVIMFYPTVPAVEQMERISVFFIKIVKMWLTFSKIQ